MMEMNEMADQIDTWDDESVADLISDAMSDVHDMDTGFRDFAKAAVRALREEGLLPSVGSAEATIRALADELTAGLKTKYPRGSVEFWIGSRGRQITCFLNDAGSERRPYFAGTLADAAKVTRDAIAAIHSPEDYAPYFAWPQAEAAE